MGRMQFGVLFTHRLCIVCIDDPPPSKSPPRPSLKLRLDPRRGEGVSERRCEDCARPAIHVMVHVLAIIHTYS